ncbi:CCA tRNA nucleotidyltransferase [Cohnella sp.]|uniref:CCA tRNA nucleotidyltransferase n=1 Tax=Cohnella sp. TaxID=1883426 RepID=UPI0035648C78
MEQQDEILWLEGLEVIRRIISQGHEAYLVGGCVRDRFLGRSLHDIDIATSATPEEVMGLFARTIPTGLKHGTVTIMENGRSFEVTTFRQEFGYSDARRPDKVAFVLDVREDLARRDFTFNAMAIGLNGELVDPFGGKVDLEAGIVSSVGEASERFEEDALRMLRAIRFGAEFDFQLSPELWRGIVEQRPKLKQVAMERVSSEWDKMMAGSGPEQACHYLFKSGLLTNVKEPLPYAFQEAIESYRFNRLPWQWSMSFGDLGSLGSQLLELPLITDPDLRWAALLSGFGIREKDCEDLCRTLRFSGRRIARISSVVGFNERMNELGSFSTKDHWFSAVLAYGRTTSQDWLDMAEAGNRVAAEERGKLAKPAAASISELHIRGNELSSFLGKPPGPWIADLLRYLLEEVAFERVPNERAALLAAAKRVEGNTEL